MNSASDHSTPVREPLLRDGYVKLKAFLNQAELAKVREQLARFVREVVPRIPDGHVLYEKKDDPSTLKLLELSEHDAYFKKMLVEGKLPQLASAALDSPVIGKNLEFFDKPPRIGQPTPPHQDGYYFMIRPLEAVTMWLALDRADEENGCMRYVRGSHLEGMRPHGRSQTVGFSQGITDFGTAHDLTNEVVVAAQPGDLLIHHAMTIHRADGNRSPSRHRPALGFVYYSASVQEDTEALAAYQAKLRSEMREKGKI
jgi:phytanoyl-CoA hydroxylase